MTDEPLRTSDTIEDRMAGTTGVPGWFEDYKATYLAGAAHGFILAGDIYGLTPGGVSQRGYLEAALAEKREIVVRYDRARGFRFVLDSMRAKAGTLVAAQQSGQLSNDGKAMLDEITAFFGSQGMDTNFGGGDDPFGGLPQPVDALRLLEVLIRAPKARGKVAVLLDGAELLCPHSGDKSIMSREDREILGMLMGWGQDTALGKCNNPIFLLVAKLPELHADLRSSGSGYKVITVPLPTREDRWTYLAGYLHKRAERNKPIALLDLSLDELANLTAGLNLRHLEDILLLAYRSGGVSRQLVKARKDAIITSEFSEVAEMIEPLPTGFAGLGGMDHLVQWARTDLIGPLARGGEDAPKGVLLVGPPGTGKTFFVRALAFETGFNAVMLRAENILSKYVGESEAKLKQFFAFARALTPVLVFFDELDQSDLSQRGNASGNPVASNLFNQMLQFMSDESLRGKMVMIFASNRPDLIDPALLRFGRMDAIIPVLLPDEPARAEIARVQARSQRMEIADGAVSLLAARSVNYSAADIAAVISKAKKLARRADHARIEVQDIEAALGYIRPATPQIARKYTLLAIEACNDTELLPPEYAAELADRARLKGKIRAAAQEAEGMAPMTSADREDREERSW
jgi:transitional endoplasmic reticulum ATPase